MVISFIVLLVIAGWSSAEDDGTGESRFPPAEGYPSFFIKSEVVMTSDWTVDVNIFYPGFNRPSEKPIRDAAAPFPVVIFSPPMDTDSILYQDYMTSLVAQGFVVAGVSWTYEYDRDADVAWLDHVKVIDLIEELGKESSSPLYGIPDVSECGAFGYSRGGRAAFMSSTADPRISTVAAWMPTLNNASDVTGNKLLIGGAEDYTASPEEYLDPLFDDSGPPIIYIIRWEDTHMSIENDFHGALTNDFFRYHLLDETSLYDDLYGDDIKTTAESGEFWLRIKTSSGTYSSYVDNDPPVADAGPDIEIEPPAMVIFDGFRSTDDKGIVDYLWSLDYDGINYLHHGIQFSITFEIPGEYSVVLSVSDEESETDVDSLIVTVRDKTPPEAVAGPDMDVDQDERVMFDGSASTDNIKITSWTWTFEYGGSPMTLHGQYVNFTFALTGTFEVALTVMDGGSNSDSASFNVTVCDATDPVADAGEDILVDQDNAFHLDGSNSTDNVGVVSWTWFIFIGDDPTVLTGETKWYSISEPGSYVVRLEVEDDVGNSASIDFTVIVRDTTDPVAAVKGELSVEKGKLLTLDGSISSDNVEVVKWYWTVKEGDVESDYQGPLLEHVFKKAGQHEVVLRVVDAAGNEASTILTVRVTEKETEAGDGLSALLTVVFAMLGVAFTMRWMDTLDR
ncbi:MAG: PKD domain-containing protein [Thermoplasmata archaeon]|nr:PKD domain-containing protein [Thermoplasmata archaeon]